MCQPALVAALWPGYTYFYRPLLTRTGLALGTEAIEQLCAPIEDAETMISVEAQREEEGAPPPPL